MFFRFQHPFGVLGLAVFAFWVFLFPGETSAGSVIRFDFETGDMQGWQVVEGRFEKLLNDRTMFRNRKDRKFNKQGEFFLDTVEAGRDRQTGVVESPVFVLRGAEVTMLIGGGGKKDTYVALCGEDGTELLKARGENDEVFVKRTWDTSGHVGRKVFVRIVDHNTGGWGHVLLDNLVAEGTLDPEATEAHFAASRSNSTLLPMAEDIESSIAETKAVVEHIRSAFPGQYPHVTECLKRLGELRRKYAALKPQKGDFRQGNDFTAEYKSLKDQLIRLRHDVLSRHPLLTAYPLLFVVRQQYRKDHHNTATIFQTGEINTGKFTGPAELKILDLSNEAGAETILRTDGVIRDLEVSFDGKQVLFAMRRSRDEDYHIFEMNVDGTGLTQLTRAPGVSDIDPLYLPDRSIVFSSTREPKYCMCNRHIMANLFRMDEDGANIHQIGKSTLFEGHSTLLPDGRILYDRWEYVDRNFGDAQGLWTVNPDGTAHAIYYGNNTASPGGVIDARSIPGTDRVIAVLSSCHDRPWGALGIIDRSMGVDGRDPIVRTWPESAIEKVTTKGSRQFDVFKSVRPRYEDPYPLSESFFLCARTVGNGNRDERTGIFLLDLFGDDILLHEEPELGCFNPVLIAPHPPPPVIPAKRNYRNDSGRFYVQNVYVGTHMKGVKRGEVKWLRVVESPPKYNWVPKAWKGQGAQAPAMNWHSFENKRILGTVPVEKDGSAYFEVPADKFVFFQLLDSKGRMIQSMRSGTIIQSGETQGCLGCHEGRVSDAPEVAGDPAATRRPPDTLKGWHGQQECFSYTREIQPILDRNCVKCHDFGKRAGEKLNLCGDRNTVFNISYCSLWDGDCIRAVGGGPPQIQPARSWGSSASKLVNKLLAGHGDVRLTPEELDRIITWVDLNGPYYPVYDSAYPGNLAGRCPLTDKQIGRLRQLTGVNLARLNGHNASPGEAVSFKRPELSGCLKSLEQNSPEYAEALAIIRTGKEALAETPRADMPGFVPSPVHRERLAKYARREEEEMRLRAAIRSNEKEYDPSPGK